MSASGATKRVVAAAALALGAGIAFGPAARSQGVTRPELPKGNHVLFGRVVDAGTNAPVGGALVSLTAYLGPAGPIAPGTLSPRAGEPGPVLVTEPRNVYASGDGAFLFRDLPAGRYMLEGTGFGYIKTSYLLRSTPVANATPSRIHFIEIADNDRPQPLEIRLSKYGAISGVVTDERGEPLVGAPVSVFVRRVEGSPALAQAGTNIFTDDRGVYRASRLEPGHEYYVGVVSSSRTITATAADQFGAANGNSQAMFDLTVAFLPGGSSVRTGEGTRVGDFVMQRLGPIPPPGPDGRVLAYATTYSPAATNFADATAVTLASGEERTGVDLTLRPVSAVRVEGVVQGPQGPMPNIGVRLDQAMNISLSDFNASGTTTAVTDAQGRFVFPAATPGAYKLQAAFIQENRPPAEDVSLWTSQPIVVADQNIGGIVLSMRPGIRISGRLEFKGSQPNPLQQGPMAFVLQPIGASSWRSLVVRTAPDGTFTSAGDPPGRYVIAVNPIPGWTLETITRGGTIVPDELIGLDGPDLTDIVLTFSDKRTRLSGSVVDAKGAVDPTATVVAFPASEVWRRQGLHQFRRECQAAVTKSGTFSCFGLPSGEYVVVALPAQVSYDFQDPDSLDRLVAGATKITLNVGEEKSVALKTFTPRDH